MKKFVFSVILGLVMMPVFSLDAKEPEKNPLPFKYEVRVEVMVDVLFWTSPCYFPPDAVT